MMLAAGFDLPYVQDQVRHAHPATTLAIYAKVIRRSDRETLRRESRALMEQDDAIVTAPGPISVDFQRARAQRRFERPAREAVER